MTDVYKTTATNCKGTPNCIAKISNRRLIKMSTQDVSKKSFKDVFWKHLLKLKKTSFCFTFITYFLLFYILSKRCYNFKFLTTLLQKMWRFYNTFTTSVVRPSINVADIKSCFWSLLPVSIQRKAIFGLA